MPLGSAVGCQRLGAISSGDVVVGPVRLGAARAPRQFLEGVHHVFLVVFNHRRPGLLQVVSAAPKKPQVGLPLA